MRLLTPDKIRNRLPEGWTLSTNEAGKCFITAYGSGDHGDRIQVTKPLPSLDELEVEGTLIAIRQFLEMERQGILIV